MSENGIFDRDKITRIKTLLKFNPKGLTITEISQKLKLSRISVSKYLDILLISGQVEMKMYGVAKAFFLSARVPISAMLSFSSDFILILDNNLQILQINDNFLNFLGVEKSILLGTNLADPTLSFLKGLPFQLILESKTDQREIVREVSTTQDGTQYYFRVKIIPTVFDDGSQGVTAILENITEAKQSDKVKSFLAAIVESSHEAIIGKDLTGKILSWNSSAERIYGYTAEEIIGQNIEILVPDEFKKDLPYIFERIKRGETISNYETKRRKKGGEILDALVTISPIRDDIGSIIAISTVCKDITNVNKLREDLRIKREKLNQIIEFLPDPTFIVDRNKNILGWNKALEDFTGIKKSDMIGQFAVNRIKSISGTYRPLLIDYLNKPTEELPSIYSGIKQTNDSISAELYLPKKKAYIWVKASPLYDKEGNFIGGIEIIRDISKSRTTEESLQNTRELLEKEMEDKIKILIDDNTRLQDELEKHQDPLNTRILMEKALDSLSQRLIILDYKGDIKYVSDAMALRLGIADKKDAIGSNIFQMMDPGACQAILQLLVDRNKEPIDIVCSFNLSSDSSGVPITVSLIGAEDNISGFIIRDHGISSDSLPEEIGLASSFGKLNRDRSKQVISQLLLLTPLLTILADFIEII
jgi:PAS domain S-box-containing protein